MECFVNLLGLQIRAARAGCLECAGEGARTCFARIANPSGRAGHKKSVCSEGFTRYTFSM